MIEWRTIGELCNLATGGTPPSGKEEFYADGSIDWIVSGDIHKKHIYEATNKITPAGLAACNAKILQADSVLIALNGQGKTRGTVAMLHIPAACNQSVVCLTPQK